MTPVLPDFEHLSLAEQVAQMVVVRASGHLFDHQIQYPVWEPTADVLRHWLQDLGVGGVILLGGSAAEVALRSQQLQDWANIPLLISADIEEGVGQRFAGATWFPPPMALGAIAQSDLAQAIAYAKTMGACVAQEALAIGINWVLAPVVDVNNNPQNPVINVRAFGETAEQVNQLIRAFIHGAQQHPVLTTAKHFPGHGDTVTDSHLELPTLPHSQQRLEDIELPPFISAIAAGVDAVMTAHLQIPSLDPDYPATLSHRILTQTLRQTLGFDGLIVTDALVMGAIANRYGANEAPVLAVEAGADILLMPVDPEGAIRAVCEAVETGRLSPEPIQASVRRIWQAKQKVGALSSVGGSAHAWERVPPPPIHLDKLATPQAIATANAILRDSMTVHCPHSARLNRVDAPHPCRNLILVDEAINCAFLGRQAPAIALPRQLGYSLQIIDSYTPDSPLNQQRTEPKHTEPKQPTLLQVFIRGNPFRSSANLMHMAQDWLHYLLGSHQLDALVIYGSPYALQQVLPKLPPELPYIFTYGQMPDAQAIALETLFGDLLQPQPQAIDRQFTT